jgi:protein-tyrosine kinase
VGKISSALHKATNNKSPAVEDILPQAQSETNTSTYHNSELRKPTLPVQPVNNLCHGSRDRWDERLLEATSSLSGTAESFRKLRTLILHPDNDKAARSIMVLSAEPQEGKSFVSANLGVAIANDINHKALLVDCDLRRPSLHTLFGLNCQKGFVDYLQGDEDNILSLAYDTGLPNLSLIPAGKPPANPSELLSSAKMNDVVKRLTSSQDNQLLILDSPPFQVAAETLVLGQLVDKILIVVRWGKSSREVIKKMATTFDQEKIIGLVFNAFEMNILDKKMQGVGYHKYYSQSYY